MFKKKESFREKLLREKRLENVNKYGKEMLIQIDKEVNRKEQAQKILRVLNML